MQIARFGLLVITKYKCSFKRIDNIPAARTWLENSLTKTGNCVLRADLCSHDQ